MFSILVQKRPLDFILSWRNWGSFSVINWLKGAFYVSFFFSILSLESEKEKPWWSEVECFSCRPLLNPYFAAVLLQKSPLWDVSLTAPCLSDFPLYFSSQRNLCCAVYFSKDEKNSQVMIEYLFTRMREGQKTRTKKEASCISSLFKRKLCRSKEQRREKTCETSPPICGCIFVWFWCLKNCVSIHLLNALLYVFSFLSPSNVQFEW